MFPFDRLWSFMFSRIQRQETGRGFAKIRVCVFQSSEMTGSWWMLEFMFSCSWLKPWCSVKPEIRAELLLCRKCLCFITGRSEFHVSSLLGRSLWIRCGLLLHLPALALWDQYCPHRNDRSLRGAARGQWDQQLSTQVACSTSKVKLQTKWKRKHFLKGNKQMK